MKPLRKVKRIRWYNDGGDYKKIFNPLFELTIRKVVRDYGKKLEADRKANVGI